MPSLCQEHRPTCRSPEWVAVEQAVAGSHRTLHGSCTQIVGSAGPARHIVSNDQVPTEDNAMVAPLKFGCMCSHHRVLSESSGISLITSRTASSLVLGHPGVPVAAIAGH